MTKPACGTLPPPFDYLKHSHQAHMNPVEDGAPVLSLTYTTRLVI